MTELNMEATRASPKPSKPRSVSTPTQARAVPPSVTNTRSLPPTDGNSKPTAETATISETERSAYETETQKDAQPDDSEADQGDSDDAYGSPFSSPIAEFLEAATDHAGLGKDAARTTRLTGQPSEFKDRPSSIAHEQGPITWAMQNGNMGPSPQVGHTLSFTEPPNHISKTKARLFNHRFHPIPRALCNTNPHHISQVANSRRQVPSPLQLQLSINSIAT